MPKKSAKPRRKKKEAPGLKEIEMAFGAALSEMRRHTHQEVSEVMEDIPCLYQEPLALQSDPTTREIRQTEALFDGILDALAQGIIDRAYGGEEVILAERVCERLVTIVEMKSCSGRA